MTKTASVASLITDALKDHMPTVRRVEPSSWLCPAGRASGAVTVRLEGDWLMLEAGDNGPGREESGPELLALNACLPLPAKWVQPLGGAPRLCAEVALEPAERLREAAGVACAAMLQAAAVQPETRAFASERWAEEEEPGTDSDPALRGNVRGWCEELGWRHHRRPGGRLVIDLDVPGEFYQAQFGRAGRGASLFVEMVPAMDELAPACRAAVAAALLGCASGVRGVRATARGPDGGGAAGLEVALSSHPDARELEWALSCLSVACCWCAREISILQEEGMARQYLAVQGIGVPALA